MFGAVMHVRHCSCAPILRFSLWRQMQHSRPPNSELQVFFNFVAV